MMKMLSRHWTRLLRQRSLPARLCNQAGQGALEYILLLSVISLIALGAIFQLNSAFGSYAQDYFVNYLSCLLETGELPSLGTASIASGECNAQFEAFSLSRGRPLIDSSNNGGSGGGGSGSQPSNSSRSFGRRGSPSTQSRGGGTPNAEFAVNNSGRPSQQSGGGGASRKAKKKSESEAFGSSRQRRRRQRATSRTGVPSAFLVSKSREAAAAVRTVALKKTAVSDLNLRKAVLKKSLEKPKPPKEFTLEAEWGFSTYIRFFMIAGIIIALGVLLGGQIMQLRKNWEKSE